MSFFSVFDTAGSGMTAQRLRLNITSSNMANADTVSSSTEETYRARQPVFAAEYDKARENSSNIGVSMKAVVESEAPLKQEYNPNHPMANEDGYIFRPNVNVMEEMANMISAQRSYSSNMEVFNSAKQMYMRTLQMGQ